MRAVTITSIAARPGLAHGEETTELGTDDTGARPSPQNAPGEDTGSEVEDPLVPERDAVVETESHPVDGDGDAGPVGEWGEVGQVPGRCDKETVHECGRDRVPITLLEGASGAEMPVGDAEQRLFPRNMLRPNPILGEQPGVSHPGSPVLDSRITSPGSTRSERRMGSGSSRSCMRNFDNSGVRSPRSADEPR